MEVLSPKEILRFDKILPPLLQFFDYSSEYINTESVVLAYNLTDAHGGPADLTVSSSQGDVAISSNQIQLSNLVEGPLLLQLEIFDKFNNRASQSYFLFVDFSSPIHRDNCTGGFVNSNFDLAFLTTKIFLH